MPDTQGRGPRITPFMVLVGAIVLGALLTVVTESANVGMAASVGVLCMGVIVFERRL